MTKPGTAILKGRKWIISAEPHVLLKLKGLFPKIARGSFGSVEILHTPDTAKDLEWFSSRYPLEFDPIDALETQARIYDKRHAELKKLLDPNYTPVPCKLALPLRQYQEVAVDQLFSQSALLLSDVMGLGKTCCAIGAFSKCSPAVVVCDTHMTTQWQAECKRFLPDCKPHIVKKTKPYALPAGTDLLIITYSKLAGWADYLQDGSWPLVVFDEAQSLRHSGTDKYRAATAIAAAAKYRLSLSGTPIYGYGVEFFNIIEILKPGLLGEESEFRREWCGYSDSVRDPVALGSFLRAEGILLRRTTADVGRELPKLQQLVYPVHSDHNVFDKAAGNAAELARLLLEQGVSFHEKGMAARELDMRLRQATGLAKAPAVADFVKVLAEDAGKVVLCGWHRGVYDIWLDTLRDLNPVMYTGSESPAQKDASKKAFIEGNAKVFIMSLRSGAGLDGLQKVCSNIVFGELDWSKNSMAQCVARVYRDGQINPVSAFTLVSEDGSDPVIAQIIGLKHGQHVGVVDLGEAEITEQVPEERVKEMARSFLAKRG